MKTYLIAFILAFGLIETTNAQTHTSENLDTVQEELTQSDRNSLDELLLGLEGILPSTQSKKIETISGEEIVSANKLLDTLQDKYNNTEEEASRSELRKEIAERILKYLNLVQAENVKYVKTPGKFGMVTFGSWEIHWDSTGKIIDGFIIDKTPKQNRRASTILILSRFRFYLH